MFFFVIRRNERKAEQVGRLGGRHFRCERLSAAERAESSEQRADDKRHDEREPIDEADDRTTNKPRRWLVDNRRQFNDQNIVVRRYGDAQKNSTENTGSSAVLSNRRRCAHVLLTRLKSFTVRENAKLVIDKRKASCHDER